jgi:uncharacterized protein (TIGR02466 family)
MKSKVFPLFPTPLYVTTYEGDTSQVIDYFNGLPMKETPGGNYGEISNNSYVLDNPVCDGLKQFFMKEFKEFATNIMRYRYTDLAFAQSWVSYKKPGQFHKAHTHPNTLLSGVFYYDTQPGDASIVFSREIKSFNRPYIEPSVLDDYQQYPFSQDEIYFTPSNNNFIIFPSYLTHGVPPNKTSRIRKSLGVNILTKQTLGDRETISEIIFSRYA